MEEAKTPAAQQQHHQQNLMMQQRQNQQQMLMLQQLQKQQQQAAAMSRFPSNIDAHLRPPGLSQRLIQQNSSGATMPNLQQLQLQQQMQQQLKQQQQQQQQPQQQQSQQMQQQQTQSQQQQHQQQQKMIRPGNQVELQMAYQDAWRVCHPDFKRPFSSLEDACERLLPYHVVADYEAEEDDRILDSDTTGQLPSRSQQWDHNIAAKVAEFTTTFEKQAFAFNLITRKRATGEFRNEERLMIEQALLQEEKRALLELRQEIELREKAGREAHESRLRMAAMAQAEHSRAESQSHADIMSRGIIRANSRGGSHQGVRDMQQMNHGMEEQEKGMNPDEMMNGWGSSGQREDKEPSEDFLNDDEENDNGEDTVGQDDWREVGEFDLNAKVGLDPNARNMGFNCK